MFCLFVLSILSSTLILKTEAINKWTNVMAAGIWSFVERDPGCHRYMQQGDFNDDW